MGSSGGGTTKTTTNTTPWGPQQGYLEDIFGKASTVFNNAYNNGLYNIPQSSFYQNYFNAAGAQGMGALPGGDQLNAAYMQALQAPSYMTPRIQAAIDAGYQPGVDTRLAAMLQSGYGTNQALPYLNNVLRDISTSSVLPQGQNLYNQMASNTGVAQQEQDRYIALADMWKQAYGNESIDALRNMAGSQWSNPYTSALIQGGESATDNPFMQQIVNAATAGNQYIPGVGNAAYQQTGNPFIDAIMSAGNQGNSYIGGLAGASGLSNPLVGGFLDIGGQANPYIQGTSGAAALAMANPALSQLQQTASGAFLTPDTNPYLQQAVQAAQEQSLANIASQFNQGGRYGSGMMAGTQAHELGNIATTAYANQYEAERQKQLAAQQALGGQYLQGVGQLTAGQQAAGQMQQAQQGIGLGALGQAAGLTQQQIQNIIGGQQAAAGLTQAQQQLGLGAAESAGGLTQQGLSDMLQGLINQANLQQGQQALGVQGIGQAGQMYGTGIGQLLSAIQGAGGLRGQQQQLAQQAMSEAGQQYGTAVNQDIASQQAAAQVAQNQIMNAQNSFQALMEAQNARAQQQLAGGSLYGQLSGSDLDRQFQAQQAATQGYMQNIANQMQSQQYGTNALLQSLGLGQQAMGFAPVMQGMQNEQLQQLLNAAQTQQQLFQMPEQTAWDRLANYLAMINGSYGGTSTSRAPGAGSNLYGNILGGVTTGIGLASLFSSRTLKRPVAPVDPSAIAEEVIGLPLTTWQYNGADEIHIGPYAEDFRDRFGVGDGFTIKYVDMFGVLFATVQHLLTKNAEQAAVIDSLAARIEELEYAL